MAADRCHGMFLLETKVRLDHQASSISEDPENPTNSVDGAVTLLTRAELIERLGELFPYLYAPAVPVWHEQFPADWDNVPACQWPIRTVLVGARSPLSSAVLRPATPHPVRD